MSAGEPARRPGLLAGVAAGSVVAAALLWVASAAVWYVDTPDGRGPVEITGATASPALTAVALFALAGVAALVATAGLLRRLVGVLLALAGVAVGLVGLGAVLAPAEGTAGSPTLAPLLAVAGGLLLLGVGVVVLLREARLARFGARYAAPGQRRAELDPDRAAWQDLDAGRDPTADLPAERVDDPGDGRRAGPV